MKKRWFFSFGHVEWVKSYTFSFSNKTFLSFLFLLSLCLCVSLWKMSAVGSYFDKIEQNKMLEEENRILKSQLSEFNQAIDSVKSKLGAIRSWETQIRKQRNFKPVDPQIRQMGIGGVPSLDSATSKLPSELRLDCAFLKLQLEQLTARVELETELMSELKKNSEFRKDMYDNTPTIYPVYGYVTSPYGYRVHPILGRKIFHEGIDIANRKGTSVHATADGVVIMSKTTDSGSFGKNIIIRHKYGFSTRYAHLSEVLAERGQKIKKGEIIGFMGSTGRSTGSHLHYEVRRYGRYRDPEPYLSKSTDLNLAAK